MASSSLALTFLNRSQTSVLARAGLVVAGVLMLAISARIQVPFWPVPMTLQTAAVLLIGASYGARLGGATLLAYLAAGAVGAPVFAGGAGLAYMAGPTGGYLAGFLAAAIIMGWLCDRGFGRRLLPAIAMLLLGQIIIIALGVAWLAGLIGFSKAVAAGLVPFLPAEVLKTALAGALLAAGWSAAVCR